MYNINGETELFSKVILYYSFELSLELFKITLSCYFEVNNQELLTELTILY